MRYATPDGLLAVVCPDCGTERAIEVAGATLNQLARRYPVRDGTPTGRCHGCVATEGNLRRSHPRLKDPVWLASMYEQMSANRIAELLNLQACVVLGWLDRHGIERRTRSEANRLAAVTKSEMKRFGRNRQMVTGDGHADYLPGTVKHFGDR